MVFRKSSTWSTVSYVNDTPANIRNFVSCHLGIGVTQTRLIFDNLDDPSFTMFSHLPEVRTYACGEEFWLNSKGLDEVPSGHNARQNNACTFGYNAAKEDWALHLNTDEFLHVPLDNPIACLRDVPADVLAVRLRPAELVLLEKPSDYDFYRLPMNKHQVRAVHNEFAANFIRRLGFFGHLDRMSFIRGG